MPERVLENYIDEYGVHSRTIVDTETGDMHTTHRQDYSGAVETVKQFEEVGNRAGSDMVFVGSLPMNIILDVQRKIGTNDMQEAVQYILKNASEYRPFLSSGKQENKIFLGA